MKKPNRLFSSWNIPAGLAAVCLFISGVARAQVLVYQQGFDNPIGANGDVYFGTSSIYNGITDGTSSQGITTGGSFNGQPLPQTGIIVTTDNGLNPQSGGFFLAENTNDFGPSYVGTVFSTAGVSIHLFPHSQYQLTFYLADFNLINSPTIQPMLNGVAIGGRVSNNQAFVFQKFTFNFNSGTTLSAVLSLFNGTSTGFGNDFALDSVSLTLLQLAQLPTSGLTPNQRAIAGSLNSGAGTALFGKVLGVYLADPAAYPGALDQLSPEAFGRFAMVTAFNNASFENEAMDNYLAGERRTSGGFFGGNGSIDARGLSLNDSSYDPTLSMVHSRLMAWNPPSDRNSASDVAGSLLGGVDMKDSKEMKTASAYNDPWNFFVRGNVILAQGFSQPDVGHFDDNTESVVLGTDYRLTPNLLVGLKAGYAHTDATLDNHGSSATVDSYSPALYASYADKGWYANLTGDYIHNAYTQARNIGFLGQTASSAPEGNVGLANLDGGYDFHRGAWTLGPIAGVQYTHLTVDAYGETGSIADLRVNEQQDDSLRSRLGGRVSWMVATSGLTFRPHLDATWQHEFMDQARGITSQFDGTGLGSFTVRTENPQQDFALATAGLDTDISRTVTAFAEYMVQAGQDNYFGQSVQAGVKIGF